MKYLHKSSVILVILLAITSCSKDFLDVDPIGKLTEDQFYKTDEDATKAIMAAYDILQWMHARDWNSAYLVKTFPSDESNVGGENSGDQPPLQELDFFNYGSSNATITATWQSNYFGIYRANKVIQRVQPETDVRKQIIAEAKFLRAWYYFEIVSMFGTGPLILNELTPSEYGQPFASAEAIYQQIETDLNEAISVLPLKSEYAPEDVFRASRGAAQTLLGKALLYQEKWNDAASVFEEVITSGEYELQENFATLFLKESEYGVESIFEVDYVSSEGYVETTFQWGGNRAMENNITWQLTGPRADWFVPGSSGIIGGWGFNCPRESSYQVFIEEGDVTRRPYSVISLAELKSMGGNWKKDDAWGWDGYIRIKYTTWASETNELEGATARFNYGSNLRLLRFADVLLMAAEANYRAGNNDKAAQYLNRVRDRANLEPFQGDIFQAIVKERQMELCFEGVRFLDLIRWGMAEDVLGEFGFVAGKHELYPIPDSEMRNNSNAVQNPKY
ncbi:MAG: RagB/SusD family nutrient uptake outer membrane protein [Lentimicrobiaceae bacterium]|nr:RagB/SusD family nutrient uptake outer membrane protein [Lentimicrobiaceae bacterium]